MGQIKWYKRDPSAALNGMMELDLQERGAYNTVLDLIYSRDGNLPDDDRFIAGWLRVDVRVWKRIKNTLIERGKLFISDGMLRNERADVEVLIALSRVASASDAGRASADSRRNKFTAANSKNNHLASTDVATGVQTTVSTNHNYNQIEEEPKGSPSSPISPKPKAASKSVRVAMTPDWQPSDLSGDVGEMVAQWPDGRLAQEVSEFREYWIETREKRPGWDRTFRSRIRNIHPRVMRDHHGNRDQTRSAAPGHSGQRDRRDSFTRAIDDELGLP